MPPNWCWMGWYAPDPAGSKWLKHYRRCPRDRWAGRAGTLCTWAPCRCRTWFSCRVTWRGFYHWYWHCTCYLSYVLVRGVGARHPTVTPNLPISHLLVLTVDMTSALHEASGFVHGIGYSLNSDSSTFLGVSGFAADPPPPSHPWYFHC